MGACISSAMDGLTRGLAVDLASPDLFLVGQEFATGQTMVVDGGSISV